MALSKDLQDSQAEKTPDLSTTLGIWMPEHTLKITELGFIYRVTFSIISLFHWMYSLLHRTFIQPSSVCAETEIRDGTSRGLTTGEFLSI